MDNDLRIEALESLRFLQEVVHGPFRDEYGEFTVESVESVEEVGNYQRLMVVLCSDGLRRKVKELANFFGAEVEVLGVI